MESKRDCSQGEMLPLSLLLMKTLKIFIACFYVESVNDLKLTYAFEESISIEKNHFELFHVYLFQKWIDHDYSMYMDPYAVAEWM